jgi:hypothetical protein
MSFPCQLIGDYLVRGERVSKLSRGKSGYRFAIASIDVALEWIKQSAHIQWGKSLTTWPSLWISFTLTKNSRSSQSVLGKGRKCCENIIHVRSRARTFMSDRLIQHKYSGTVSALQPIRYLAILLFYGRMKRILADSIYLPKLSSVSVILLGRYCLLISL